MAKHGAALQRSRRELQNLKLPARSREKLQALNERATPSGITSNAMINACWDFLELAEAHSWKWPWALQECAGREKGKPATKIYFDAVENAPLFITVAADPTKHHRRAASNLSGTNEGRADDWNLDDRAPEGFSVLPLANQHALESLLLSRTRPPLNPVMVAQVPEL
uniref:Uncharacterized protein n=1 Tax=Sphaerodactylus townsendi TaxID=933632 RepID=A0ACB8ENF1_9SAUR